MMKLNLQVTNESSLHGSLSDDSSVNFCCSASNLLAALKLFAANSFNEIVVKLNKEDGNALDKECARLLFSIIKEGSNLNIQGLGDQEPSSLISFMKLNGFQGIEFNSGELRAQRQQWQASGAPLKRKAAPQV